MILIEAHGNRWRERDVFLARYGVGWLHSYVLPGQSLWAVPITAKDPLPLLRTAQLGKHGRDKSVLLVPPGRWLAGCTNNVKGSFAVIGAALPRGVALPRPPRAVLGDVSQKRTGSQLRTGP